MKSKLHGARAASGGASFQVRSSAGERLKIAATLSQVSPGWA
jgi:hypothetical protein